MSILWFCGNNWLYMDIVLLNKTFLPLAMPGASYSTIVMETNDMKYVN